MAPASHATPARAPIALDGVTLGRLIRGVWARRDRLNLEARMATAISAGAPVEGQTGVNNATQ
jgi:hypothetical protein